MTRLLLLSCILCVAVFATDSFQEQWKAWKTKFSRSYSSFAEEEQRLNNFAENLKIISILNKKYNPTTYFGTNQFSDLTNEEFRNKIGGKVKPKLPTLGSHKPLNKAIPSEVDWRKEGAVTPIYDQLQCGSSPYFAAVTSIEGAWKIAGNKLVTLSVQQILDCSGSFGNNGCDGGEMNYSISYAAKYGLQTNFTYPYTGTSDNCVYDESKVVAHVSKFIETDGSEKAFTEALTIAPVATAINAYSSAWQNYKSGILNDPECNSAPPDHGIGAVGYGTDSSGKEYYILKNSWGTTWGMDGYVLVARNANNMCGVASDGCYAVI